MLPRRSHLVPYAYYTTTSLLVVVTTFRTPKRVGTLDYVDTCCPLDYDRLLHVLSVALDPDISQHVYAGNESPLAVFVRE